MGKKSTKTTSTSSPPAWAVPIIQGGAQSLSNTYNQNQPGLQALQSGLTGSVLPQLRQQMQQTGQQLQPGYNYVNSTLGTNPGLSNPANAQLSAYGNGNYLNENNPAVQQLAQFAGQQAGNSINSAFSASGRTGSDNNITDTARGVTQAELAPLLQNNQFEQQMQMEGLSGLGSNYNTGLGIQANAAGMLPAYTNAQYAGYTPLLAGTQLAGQLPYYGSGTLGSIGSLLGNYGTQTSTQPGGWGTGLLGAASNMFSFAPIKLSDRRLKTNIKKVGEASDGLSIYTWNWKSDPSGPKVKGVIADEVETLRPWAFVPNFNGEFAGVNYASLGSLA